MFATVKSDTPSSVPYRPTCCPLSLNQPSTSGTRMAAGNRRRATTPPTLRLVTTTIRPRSGRAQDAGREHYKRHRRYGDVGGVAVQIRDTVEIAGESQYGEYEHSKGEVLGNPEAAAGP